MADSNRKDIIDAFLVALAASTGIEHATGDLEPWWDWPVDNFPGVIVIDGSEKKGRAYYSASTSAVDMESDFEVTVRGYVHDFNNVTLAKQTNLLRDIEVSVMQSTAIGAAALDVEPTSLRSDRNSLDNFGTAEVVFNVKYQYNHAKP